MTGSIIGDALLGLTDIKASLINLPDDDQLAVVVEEEFVEEEYGEINVEMVN